MVKRIMFGIFIDVTGRKQAEEGRELLAGEMSHRVKNLLAIASGLTAITSRSTTTTEQMAHELTQRLTALGRAHDLVRPLPDQTTAASALLGDLLSVLLAPYDDLGAFSGRIRVSVPRMSVGDLCRSMMRFFAADKAGLDPAATLSDELIHRLMHGSLYRLGIAIDFTIDAIQEALRASSPTLTPSHFALAFSRTGADDDNNVFLVSGDFLSVNVSKFFTNGHDEEVSEAQAATKPVSRKK